MMTVPQIAGVGGFAGVGGWWVLMLLGSAGAG